MNFTELTTYDPFQFTQWIFGQARSHGCFYATTVLQNAQNFLLHTLTAILSYEQILRLWKENNKM